MTAAVPPETGIDAAPFAVVDVETTGTSPARGARVTEIAVVRVAPGGAPEVVLETLVDPGVPIPPFIEQLTGITDDLVRGAPAFHAVAREVRAALAEAVFVAHNARFDWSFVSAELAFATGAALAGARLCTVRLTRRYVPELRHRNLDAVTEHFGVANGRRHRAAGDALATADVLARLLAIARERGAATLGELPGFRVIAA